VNKECYDYTETVLLKLRKSIEQNRADSEARKPTDPRRDMGTMVQYSYLEGNVAAFDFAIGTVDLMLKSVEMSQKVQHGEVTLEEAMRVAETWVEG
jgi:hypothetical protein